MRFKRKCLKLNFIVCVNINKYMRRRPATPDNYTIRVYLHVRKDRVEQ